MKLDLTGWQKDLYEQLGITEEETADLTDCEERSEIIFRGGRLPSFAGSRRFL